MKVPAQMCAGTRKVNNHMNRLAIIKIDIYRIKASGICLFCGTDSLKITGADARRYKEGEQRHVLQGHKKHDIRRIKASGICLFCGTDSHESTGSDAHSCEEGEQRHESQGHNKIRYS